MSFLHTLATLAKHAAQTAEAPLHSVANAGGSFAHGLNGAQGQQPLKVGQQGFIPYADPQRAAQTVPMLQQLQMGRSNRLNGAALQEPYAPVTFPRADNYMGVPDYQANPQGGFGMQVQNVGQPTQRLQADYTPWQNMGPRRPNMVNPQVEDNGYYWYQ